MAELTKEHEHRLRAKAKTRAAHVTLNAEEGRTRAVEASVVIMKEEVRRLSLVIDGCKRNGSTLSRFLGVLEDNFYLHMDQPGMHF